MAGAGLDAYIVHTLNPWLKERFGKAAYWIGGFWSLLRVLPEFQVENGERVYRASFALASRVRNYGGDLEIARTIRLDDPEFEVVLFEGWLALAYLKYFYGIATNRLRGMHGVHIFRTGRLRMTGDALAHIDGEPMGPLPVELEIVPDALTLLMPPEYGV
jgi:diacylglycerol kinase family enzyme